MEPPLLSEIAVGATLQAPEFLPSAEALMARHHASAPRRAALDLGDVLRAAGAPSTAELLLSELLDALDRCAEPAQALRGLARWVSALASPSAVLASLLDDPLRLRDLTTVLAGSQYLSDVLARDPYAFDLLHDASPSNHRGRNGLAREVRLAVQGAPHAGAQLDVLRRVKRREMLRIGWRDLTARDDMPATAAAITELAEVLVREALLICRAPLFGTRPSFAFAVIALGKLGGCELNYSSDIDLLLLYEPAAGADSASAGEMASRLGEALIAALTQPAVEGWLYRVDMRLRPEGRFGALARTLDGMEEYFGQWAEPWERQALIRARFVAGDPALGLRFEALAAREAYLDPPPPTFLEDIRANKEAIEAKVSSAGEAEVSVKEGRGAIRDVEFAIQFLQLIFGSSDPSLRTGNALDAIDRLWRAGLLSTQDETHLSDAYRFLRTVENRLQLFDDRPVRCLPRDPKARAALARSMGYRRGYEADFDAEFRRHTALVMEATSGLFALYDPDADAPARMVRGLALALDTRSAQRELVRVLAQRALLDAERVVESLARLAGTTWRGRRAVADILAPLLDAIGTRPDPASALGLMETLAERRGGSASFLKDLAAQPQMLEWVAALGGSGLLIPGVLARRRDLEWLLDPGRARIDASQLFASAVPMDNAADVGRLADAKQAAMIRLAVRHVSGPADEETTGRDLCVLARSIVQAALLLAWRSVGHLQSDTAGRYESRPCPASTSSHPHTGFAVVALGRLGGEDLGFGSDLDLLYVVDDLDGRWSHGVAAAEGLGEALTHILLGSESQPPLYQVDLRLRPEGRKGALVAPLSVCARYYGSRAETWERQAMIKARYAAGDPETALRFLEMVTPWVYAPANAADLMPELRAMKARIEHERLDPAQENLDLKLGSGGLSDIEFTVQALQLLHGAEVPAVRVTRTLAGIGALHVAGYLNETEAATLADGWRFYTRARNSLYLLRGLPADVLPAEGVEGLRAARALGLRTSDELQSVFQGHQQAVRSVFAHRFQGR